MSKIIDKIVKDIKKKNQYSNFHKSFYLINYLVSFSKSDFVFNEEHIEYAKNKCAEYEKEIRLALNRLSKNKFTRQCCVSFEILSDKPNCMLSIQYQLIEDKLFCTVYQRSLDVISKLPQDFLIAQTIADKIKALIFFNKINYTFFIGNAHLYIEK
jgi:thymidylate synthase